MSARDDPDFHYRLGVDLFIHGVQAMAERLAAHSSRTVPRPVQ
jgi:hypothetical protein